MMTTTERLTLIVDIGGTNTRVAQAHNGQLDDASIKRYRNADFEGLDAVLSTYRAQVDWRDPEGVCVDIAGPIHDGKGTLTNLDWTLEEPLLAQWTGAQHAALINDLQAQGHSVADLPATALIPVTKGKDGPEHATRLVVNVGTGFNAAVVYDGPNGRMVPASESGHANMPIRTEEDLRLCRFVETAHGFPAIEDVLSGRGLERVYHWVSTEAGTPHILHAAEIMDAAKAEPQGLAAQAKAVFARILGTVTGNLALVHLPFGGIYLVGGVVRAMAEDLPALGFTEAMRDKGRFSGLVGNFNVVAIDDDYAALRGAARHMDARLRAL